MGSMVNCKNFYGIVYLIMKYAGSIIITYKKGVMAAGLGESHKSKKEERKRLFTNQFIKIL